jgi:hypothetical protein
MRLRRVTGSSLTRFRVLVYPWCMFRALVVVAGAVAIGANADAATLKKPPRSRGMQVRVGEYAIRPGEDLEVCEYRRLPNEKPIDVARFTLRMPAGAHHFAVWTYGGTQTDDAAFRQGPVESVGCTGATGDDPFPQLLIPTQSPNTELRFPKGIALQIDAREQIFLNPHMKNFGDASMTPDIRFNLYKAKKGTVKYYAEALTFGNSSDIAIPPNGDQTLTAEWTVPMNMTLIHISTHQHLHGTYANVELVSEDGTRRDLLVESHDWQHPRSVWPEGGIRIAKGQKLRVTCSWHNTEDRTVRFGPETTDEMCFGIGFFYRDPGDTAPVVGPGCLPSKKGLLCPFVPALAS